MKICLLTSQNDRTLPQSRGFLRGMLSHIADGDTLRARKTLPYDTADILVVSAVNSRPEIARPLRREAARMRARGVFLDSSTPPDAEFSASLTEHGLAVFAPFSEILPKDVTPVIEASVSGGSLAEYFEKISSRVSRFAVSVSPSSYEFSLPYERGSDLPLSSQSLSRILSRFNPDVFFSPQLYFKYFMYEPSPDRVNLVLFDDAETISHKLRLAKKHGASHAFLLWDEVADIFDEIFF